MILLSDGLGDLSKELGETSVNQTPNRIKHYNDAIQEFASERKWSFLSKKNESILTVSGTNKYSLSTITDMRNPGGIKEVQVGTDSEDNLPFIPVDYEQRHNSSLLGKRFFYIDEETNEICFLADITTTGEKISIRYYYIPARKTEVGETATFPIPDKFRKTIATLAAAYVQWGRYLDAQGNRLFNMYERLLNKKVIQQGERNAKNPRKMEHPLRWRGFKRTYGR